MRLGVLDLGSHSFHLGVYRAHASGRPLKIGRAKELCRLGAGTLWRGAIDDAAWRRGSLALDRLLEHREARELDHLVAVATSAIRDAKNGREFCERAWRRHRLKVEILSGADEARLVHRGARLGLRDSGGRVAVIDLGGGSAEIALGDSRRCRFARCLPLGALRMRDVFAAGGAAAVRDQVRRLADGSMRAMRRFAPDRIVLASGTARRLSAAAQALELRSSSRPVLTRAALARLIAHLPELDDDELVDVGVEVGRRDSIVPGAIVLDALLEGARAGAALVSSTGLREGVAVRELARLATRATPNRRPTAAVA